MADFKEMTNLIEGIIMQTAADVDRLEVGSEDRSRATKDLATLYNARIEAEKAKMNDEDQAERRKEQKRLNNEELKIKQAQLENEIDRVNFEQQSRKHSFGKDCADIALRTVTNLLALGGQVSLYGRAYAAERDGYMQPRMQLTKPADNLTKVIR